MRKLTDNGKVLLEIDNDKTDEQIKVVKNVIE